MRVRLGRDFRSALSWPLLIPMAALLFFGITLLMGIEIRVANGWRSDLHWTQITGTVVGVAAGAILLLVPYKALLSRAYLLYAFNLLLLVAVLLIGPERSKTRRWLSVAGFEFQPSELMKLTLVITLARFIRFRSSYKTFRGLMTPFLLTLLPMALILKQPDLGTALLCVPILFTMLFVAGARPRHLLTVVVLGLIGIYPIYEWGLKPYQRERIDGFLIQLHIIKGKPGQAAEMEKRQNYQVTRSKIAIGAGGVVGAHSDSGAASSLRRVPERHNDFAFAAVGNGRGLLGGFLLFGLFAWLLIAILITALRQRDPAGRLICVGVFALFTFQMFINIAMNVGLLPVTGMTLPFISYGRSSVVVSILAVALVCNVASRPSYEFGRGDFD